MSEQRQTEILENQTDEITNASIGVGYEHHEIHGGSHFLYCSFETEATNGTIDIAITTPDTAKWVHLTFFANATSRTESYLYEDATLNATPGGTAITPINNNRNSANTSVMTILKDPTIDADGTLLMKSSAGLEGTTPSQASLIATKRRDKEIMLKQNSTTVIRYVSRDDDNIISWCLEWYEHTNK